VSELDRFLEPTTFVDAHHPSIVACVESLKLQDAPPAEKARRIFRFVRDEIRYEFMAKLTREEYVASNVLADGKGFCVQKAVLLAALARSAGVPAALVLCDMKDHTLSAKLVSAIGTNVMHHHGLSALHLAGTWVRVDASLTPAVLEKKRTPTVLFDGEHDALLSPVTDAGAPHVDYVTIHGSYDDLPFEQMIAAFADAYRHADLGRLAEMGISRVRGSRP
jgi:transglutaminase-like putative cysteine protease